MDEVLALIEKIIEEHKMILGMVEKVVNDATALSEIEKAKDSFMPGRFDPRKGLEKLEESIQAIDGGLQAHFEREETALLKAFEQHGGGELVSTLRALLADHEYLRKRMAHGKTQVADLMSGELSRFVWEAKAFDIRAHIAYTRRLLETHAQYEQELLLKLRKQLREEEKAK